MKIGEPVERSSVKKRGTTANNAIVKAMKLVPAHLSLPVEYATVDEARRAALRAYNRGTVLHSAGIGANQRGTTVYFYWKQTDGENAIDILAGDGR